MKEKNKYGQYFTVDPIARFMVSIIRHEKAARVLEPSCGKGVFLTALKEAGFGNVEAYEIDRTLDNPYPNVRYESFVTSPMDEYDVVIGNPPYIRWKNLETELKEELAGSPLWNRYFNSLCDYLFIFILKGIEQLSVEGELIFICTEYWMNTTHSAALRDYMMDNGYISEIYHFKEAPLFEGVCASFIIFRFVKSQERRGTISLLKYRGKGKPDYLDLVGGTCFERVVIPQFEKGRRWLLATGDQQRLLDGFEESCRLEQGDQFATPRLYRIGDVCDIGNGMVSGLDKAFRVPDVDILTPKERESVIKVLKAKDLGQYYHKSESRYFFASCRMDEDEFEKEFPVICESMAPYRSELDKRYDYGKDIPYWEFVFPRNQALFERREARIFVPCKERVSNKNHFRFVLADEDYFPLQDVTGILKKRSCRESIEYLVAYLNDRRVFEWLGFNGIVKGYIVEFSEAPIASIPYRKINWDNESEVRIHEVITESVRSYIETQDPMYVDIIEEQFNRLFS